MPPVDRRWEFAVRSPGEFRVVRTESGPLEMWVLGIPAGQGPADAAAWLRDVAEVAREGAAQGSGALPIPRVLYHAVSGLLFAHADAWGPGRQPCSVVYSSDGDDIGLGWVGPGAAEVWIDGRRESVRLVTVRDANGRDAFAWSAPRDRDVRVVLRWPASLDEPEPFVIELESRWDGRETPEMAWFARPAATADWVQAGAGAPAAQPVATAATPPPPAEAAMPEQAYAPIDEAPALAWTPVEETAEAARSGAWEVSGVEGVERVEDLEEIAADASVASGIGAAGEVVASAPADAIASAEAAITEPAAMVPGIAASVAAAPQAEMDPARPSSGIAKWLHRNFGWLGRQHDSGSTDEPPASAPGTPAPGSVATLEPTSAADAEPGDSPDRDRARDSAPEAAVTFGAPGHSAFDEPRPAESDANAGARREAGFQAPVATDADFVTAAPPAPDLSREDELAASAAALAAMLGESLASVAGEAREAPPLPDAFEPAWRHTVEEASEMIPPTPEPREVTERAVPVGSLDMPATSASLEITGSRADVAWPRADEARPPALSPESTAAPRSDEPFRPLGVTLDDMRALAPEPVAPPAPPEPEPPASRLPSWLRMPGEIAAVETQRDPREIALSPEPVPAPETGVAGPAAPPELSQAPVFESPGEPIAEAHAVAEAEAPPATAIVPEPAPAPATPEDDLSAVAAPPARRRMPALHPEWPSDVRLEKPKPSRGPWIWLGAIIVVLFGAGWLVGMLQEPAAPGQSPRGPLGPLMGALGVRGPSYTLDVKSQPEGAWILVDGKPTEQRTPAQIPLAPGAHRVTLSFGQWGEGTFEVEGAKDATVPLDAQMWGTLVLIAPEPGSVIAVSVDGKPRGFAPLRVDSLAPGPHQVRYSGPGIVSWGQTVEIGVGKETELVTRAVTSPATGLLMVRAQATEQGAAQELSGARVWIDGKPAGATPLTRELPRGPHSIRVAWQSETPPIQVIDLPGGNQRFATFQFGGGGEYPSIRVTAPARIAADGSTVINATVDGLAPGEVREMWLHVEGEDHGWRRYPMTRLADVLSAVGAVPFPVAAFGNASETRWYASLSTEHGDEYFTEIATSRLEGRPAR